MSEATPILVAADQETKHPGFVKMLKSMNVPAEVSKYVKVDLNWFVEGKPIMLDIKTPSDFVASQRDGRLHNQMQHMSESNCLLWGFLQTGKWSDAAGMDEFAFDNEKARLASEGAVFVLAQERGDAAAAARLASFYRWTRDRFSKAGGYHAPVVIMPDNDLTRDPPLIFYDRKFRSQVGMIMHIPDVGPVTANGMREKNPLMDILGVTDEGLETAIEKIWLPTKGVGKKTIEGLRKYMQR